MPYIATSTYRSPFGFRNGHLQSILPTLFRRVPSITTRRERIETPDGDFLDLDWSPATGESKRLAILLHGLEGNSAQPYIQGMAAALHRRGWEILAWNFRGCSGEPNRLPRSYHSGATEDLATVLTHVFANTAHSEIALIGFSLGGNIVLKYLGDSSSQLDSRICGAVALSVPCDLASSAEKLADFTQRIYMRRFRKTLREKLRVKAAAHPGQINAEAIANLRTFHDIDEHFTAPLHGFASAEDYWNRCSSAPVLSNIQIPTLLLNAADDPFLAPPCYPRATAEASEHFHLEVPAHGGHVGFLPRNPSKEYWSEQRTAEFLSSNT